MKRMNVDRWGALASGICAVHCVLSGVALGLISALGMGFLTHPWLDYGFLGLAVALGGWAAWSGYRLHHDSRPSAVFVLGLLLMALAHFGPWEHHHGGPLALISAAGGLCFVGFHVWNLRLRHACPKSNSAG